MPPVVNLATKLKMFPDHWSPKIVAACNGHDVMVVKLKGEFVWHSHPETDAARGDAAGSMGRSRY